MLAIIECVKPKNNKNTKMFQNN